MFEIDSDIAKASTLPSAFYTDAGLYELSKDRVFARSWQFVGDDSAVRTPGQIYPFTLLEGCLDEPLMLTRDHSDNVHCLSNVCTHRGNLLVEGPCHGSQMRCRYHGRQFSLDGHMLSMPEFHNACDFPCKKDDLPSVPLQRWGGREYRFSFVSLNPTATLLDYIWPIEKRLSWLPWQEFRFDPTTSRDYLVKANWALYCDNYLEGFHIPFIHASLNKIVDYGTYETLLSTYGSLQIGRAKDGEECFDLPRESPDYGQKIAAYWFWVFPNLMFNFYPWGLSLNVVMPLGPSLTKVRFLTYLWRPELMHDLTLVDRVEREDEQVVECVQKGVKARLYDRGRYSPDREKGVHHFHRLLATFME